MTNPTSDAAKLLPRVFQVEVENHSDGATVTIRGINLCDTRPQPAPPAGEPDFAMTAKRLLPGDYLTKIIGDDEIRMFQACAYKASIEHELRKAFRLGLAARHKVEDAEVDAENYGPGSWRRLLVQLCEAQTKLAEREAELAKASWKRGNENSRGGQLIEAAFEYLNIPTQQNHTEYVIVRWNDGRWEFTNGDGYEGPSDELPAFYRDFETPEHYTAFG